MQLLVRRRAELIALKVAEQNRSKAPGAKSLAASFKAVLAVIKRQIETVDALIAATVARSRALKQRAEICTAMAGIGSISAASLIALMPELGALGRQVASLAGTAPTPTRAAPSRASAG